MYETKEKRCNDIRVTCGCPVIYAPQSRDPGGEQQHGGQLNSIFLAFKYIFIILRCIYIKYILATEGGGCEIFAV